MTARKKNLTICGAITVEGRICTRPVEAGRSCGFHRPPPAEDRPLPPELCRCETPLAIADDDPEIAARCLWCGHQAAELKKKRPFGAQPTLGNVRCGVLVAKFADVGYVGRKHQEGGRLCPLFLSL